MEPQFAEPTLEERQKRDYDRERQELVIGRMRAAVVRGQITRAYETLESIRFDFVADTAFRDKVVRAKKGCEQAIGDFLLDDSYWKERIKRHSDMTPTEYYEKRQDSGAHSVNEE